MADMFALDVPVRRSYCVWHRGKHCLEELSLIHTRAGFNALQDIIKKAQKPTIYFEATGIYSRVIKHFCETNGFRFRHLNPPELHLKSESLRRVETGQKDAHRITLTVQENTFRLTVPWRKDYLQLHGLSQFYSQLNVNWNYRLNHLHTALEQVFPKPKRLFVNRTSKLALDIVELFPHPTLVRLYSRVKLKNILMASTDKRISEIKAYKCVDRLIDLAQKSYPAVSGDTIQVNEVHCYARQLIALARKKEEVIKRMESIAQRLPEYIPYCSFPGIGGQIAAQLMGELGSISCFGSTNQLNTFVGIGIRRYQSGAYLDQDHTNKCGNPIARKLLYFTVGNMIRQQHANSNHIVDYYYRLKGERPHPKLNKVAMVAYMNKTLKCLLSMIEHHGKYHHRYTDSIVPVKA